MQFWVENDLWDRLDHCSNSGLYPPSKTAIIRRGIVLAVDEYEALAKAAQERGNG